MLKVFAEELHSIGIPYEFMEWTGTVQYPYFVGEYSETTPVSEDGYREGTLILTGTTKGTWLELMEIRKKIEDHFPTIYGLRKVTDQGTVVFYYAHSFPVETGVAGLKRIQINIDLKEWRCL